MSIPEICWKKTVTSAPQMLTHKRARQTNKQTTKTVPIKSSIDRESLIAAVAAAAISHKTLGPPPITLNRQKKFVDFLIIDFEPIPFPLSALFSFIY